MISSSKVFYGPNKYTCNVLAAKPKSTMFIRAGVWRCGDRPAVHEPARGPPKNRKQRDPAEQGHGTTAAAAKNITCKLKYTLWIAYYISVHLETVTGSRRSHCRGTFVCFCVPQWKQDTLSVEHAE